MVVYSFLHWNKEIGKKFFIFSIEKRWTETWHLEIAIIDYVLIEMYFCW